MRYVVPVLYGHKIGFTSTYAPGVIGINKRFRYKVFFNGFKKLKFHAPIFLDAWCKGFRDYFPLNRMMIRKIAGMRVSKRRQGISATTLMESAFIYLKQPPSDSRRFKLYDIIDTLRFSNKFIERK